MSKNQAQGEAFVARAGSFSTHGSRTGVNLLGWGENETLTPAQQHDALRLSLKQWGDALVAMKAKLADSTISRQEYLVLKDRQREVKARVTALIIELRRIKPLISTGPKYTELSEYLIAMFKESVTKPRWEAIVKEAQRRFVADHGCAPKEPQ